MKHIYNTIKRFARDEQGVATVEFVIAFPLLFGMIVLTFDTGLLMTKYVVLENALDRTVRDVRLFGISDGKGGSDYFKKKVCEIATLITDCEANLYVEMTPIDTSGSFTPSNTITCIDRTAESNPVVSFTSGAENDIVYLRACLVVDRYFPSVLSGVFAVDASGGIRLVADAAYVVEPS